MTENLKLVEYFTSAFYFKEKIELGHIASTTFGFSINSSPLKTFEEYESRRLLLSQNATLIIDEITTNDDTHFYTNFDVLLKGGKKFSGKTMLKVSRGLLERVNVDYDLTNDEFKQFEKMLMNNTTKSS